jgi:hypothetical protein
MGLVVRKGLLAEHEPALFPVLDLPTFFSKISLLLSARVGPVRLRRHSPDLDALRSYSPRSSSARTADSRINTMNYAILFKCAARRRSQSRAKDRHPDGQPPALDAHSRHCARVHAENPAEQKDCRKLAKERSCRNQTSDSNRVRPRTKLGNKDDHFAIFIILSLLGRVRPQICFLFSVLLFRCRPQR